MQSPPPGPTRLRFGLFEVDFSAAELRKRNRKIILQDQPFQVLALLLRHPGEIVTRQELQKTLWPADTFVEFDESLNKAVQKLRRALGDSPENPRFIETLPRKGYRFIAPVGGPESQFSVPRPTVVSRVPRVWTVALLAAFVFLGAVGLSLLKIRDQAPEAAPKVVPLSSYPGFEDSPSFSPDGTQVAFRWCRENAACQIYIKQIGVEPPFQLTNDQLSSKSPAWSPDGRSIAFLRQLSPAKVVLALVPQRGGRERVVAELDESDKREAIDGPFLTWSPDSKWLVCPVFEASGQAALYLFSVETGERRRLTSPPPGASHDTAPAFSPDGRTLAFTREGSRTDIYLLRVSEDYRPKMEPERIASDNPLNIGPTWLPNGREIVFASGSEGTLGLWRVAASRFAKPRHYAFPSEFALMPAISRRKDRLVYASESSNRNIWRVDLAVASRRPGIPFKLIPSTRSQRDPAYSPDGKRIVFVSEASGTPEVWVCESDGSNPVQLTAFAGPEVQGPRWSPGGESIVFQAEQGANPDIYVIGANGGPIRRLTTDSRQDKWPDWSRDGRWIYFAVSDVRQVLAGIWKMRRSGGDAVQITRSGRDMPRESPDGRFLYYQKGYPSRCSLWRIPVDGGEETRILDDIGCGSWAVDNDRIYFVIVPDGQSDRIICSRDFATGRITTILKIRRPIARGMAISPSKRTILWSQLDEIGSDLMLVENFR